MGREFGLPCPCNPLEEIPALSSLDMGQDISMLKDREMDMTCNGWAWLSCRHGAA